MPRLEDRFPATGRKVLRRLDEAARRRIRPGILAVPTLVLLLAGSAVAAPVIDLQGGWARAMPSVTRTTAGYVTIINRGDTDDWLIGARVDGVRVVEIHEMQRVGDTLRMQPRAAVAVPAGGRTQLVPVGLHLMLIDSGQPLVAGGSLDCVLKFREAGEVTVKLDLRAQ